MKLRNEDYEKMLTSETTARLRGIAIRFDYVCNIINLLKSNSVKEMQ